MDINETAIRCFNGSKDVTARDAVKAVDEPFSVWCGFFAPPEKQDPISEYVKMLFAEGQKHEARFVKEHYPGAERLEYVSQEEGFRIALAGMAKGADVLANVPLFFLPEGLYGVEDVIERLDGVKSVFGEYCYVPKEIKLATNIKEKHILQAAFYSHLLNRIQQGGSDTFRVVNFEGEVREYRLSEWKAKLDSAIRLFREIKAGKVKPTPTWNGCDWPWESYANREAIRTRDMSLIGGLGEKKKAQLEALGLHTVQDILAAPASRLLSVKGIGEKTVQSFKLGAQALETGKHIILDPSALVFPKVKTELFLDLEGTMRMGLETDGADIDIDPIDYLIGVLQQEGGKERFVPFVAHGFDQEGKMWKAFLEWIAEKRDFVLYHWHHYERIHFKQLAERHGCPAALWERIQGSMVDLLPIAKKAVMFPTYGYSLKKVAPYCGFNWRQKDVSATESIAMYAAYVQTKDKAILEKILKYNEDDVVATRWVRDWLGN